MKMNNVTCSALCLCLEGSIPNAVRGLEGALGQGGSVTTARWAWRGQDVPLELALFIARHCAMVVWDQTAARGVIWELVIFFCYMQPHFYHFCEGLYQNPLNFVGIDEKCPCRASCEGG